jgi:hypothetical protein
MDDVLKIATGVFLGGLAAIFAWEGIHVIALEVAAREAAKQMQAATQQAAEQSRLQAEATAKARAAADQAARTQQAQMQRQQADASAQAQAWKEARETAWKQFYQPSEACRVNWTGECANAFAKAKLDFQAIHGPDK